MSGHSKWATTKHKKAIVDAKRGKMFAKLVKNIEVAARIGGADPEGNPTLYDAIQKAKKSSVPKDHIDRAVKRGGGVGADSVDYTTIMYEAYAHEGQWLESSALKGRRSDRRGFGATDRTTLRPGGTTQIKYVGADDLQVQYSRRSASVRLFGRCGVPNHLLSVFH